MIKIEKVIHEDNVLAAFIRSEDWSPGLNFLCQDDDPIQVGLWDYQSGKILGPHSHVKNERKITITQEILFIKKGRVRASIYNENDELVKDVDLSSGDLIILFSGGHGYTILEDNTQVLEVKNGPYTGLNDRESLKLLKKIG